MQRGAVPVAETLPARRMSVNNRCVLVPVSISDNRPTMVHKNRPFLLLGCLLALPSGLRERVWRGV